MFIISLWLFDILPTEVLVFLFLSILSFKSSLKRVAEILIRMIKIERNIKTVTIPVNIKSIPEIINSFIMAAILYLFKKKGLNRLIKFLFILMKILYNNL